MDGRGIAVVDWDHDGDLDIWTTNRTGPRIQFFRNQTSPRRFVSIRLQGTAGNRDAIGARVELKVVPTLGTLSRTVVAGDAYLSQSSKWLHFGLGDADSISSVRIRWPGSSTLQSIDGIEPDGAYHIVQGETVARRVPWSTASRQPVARETALPTNPAAQTDSRMLITGRVPLPPIQLTIDGATSVQPPPNQPMVWLLWSPDCPVCRRELQAWSEQAAEFQRAGLDVLAIAPDLDNESLQLTTAVLSEIASPFASSLIRSDQLAMLEAYLGFLQQDYQRPLTVPTILLIDRAGQVAAINRGETSPAKVLEQARLFAHSTDQLREASVPFPGRWLLPYQRPTADRLAARLSKQFGAETAEAYLLHLLAIAADQTSDSPSADVIPPSWQGDALLALGSLALAQERYEQAEEFSRKAQRYLPRDFRAYGNEGAAIVRQQRFRDALQPLSRAIALNDQDGGARKNRALVYSKLGQHRAAIEDWEALLQIDPRQHAARLQVAAMSYAMGDDKKAVHHYQQYLIGHPGDQPVVSALAWVLATSPDEETYDGGEAIRLVRDLTDTADCKILNIQAAAWAAAGDYPQAVQRVEQAIRCPLCHNLGSCVFSPPTLPQVLREGRSDTAVQAVSRGGPDRARNRSRSSNGRSTRCEGPFTA